MVISLVARVEKIERPVAVKISFPIQHTDAYRWYILGIFLLLLGGGGVYFTRRSRATTVARSGASGRQAPNRPSAPPKRSSRSDLQFDELKNELFQLEVERQEGRIPQRDMNVPGPSSIRSWTRPSSVQRESKLDVWEPCLQQSLLLKITKVTFVTCDVAE
jgi:hypothetical protein